MAIPEGGGTDLFCQYNNTDGIPRTVGWVRDNTFINGSEMQGQCDCVSVSSGPAINLTFTNFTSNTSAGEYGCWAILEDGFDQCNFDVVVAGKGAHYYSKI